MTTLRFTFLILTLASLHLVSGWFFFLEECSDYECRQGDCVQVDSTAVRSCGINRPWWHDELRKKRQIDRYIYRIIRNDENPADGLTAKDPSQTRSIQSHVGCGSRRGYQSQYISCTADLQAAVDWARGRPRTVVQIDTWALHQQNINVVDLSQDNGSHLTGVTARNFAQRYHEVLVEGHVPASAIVASWVINNPGDPARRCHM